MRLTRLGYQRMIMGVGESRSPANLAGSVLFSTASRRVLLLSLVDGIMGDRSREQALKTIVPPPRYTPHAHDLQLGKVPEMAIGPWPGPPVVSRSLIHEECLYYSSDLRVTLLLIARVMSALVQGVSEWGVFPYIYHADAAASCPWCSSTIGLFLFSFLFVNNRRGPGLRIVLEGIRLCPRFIIFVRRLGHLSSGNTFELIKDEARRCRKELRLPAQPESIRAREYANQ